MEHPIAVELLAEELDRLARNHYADGRAARWQPGHDCWRVAAELNDLRPVRKSRRAAQSGCPQCGGIHGPNTQQHT